MHCGSLFEAGNTLKAALNVAAISSDFLEAIEAIEMIVRVKYKHHQDENGRGNREYWRREKALDEALKNTFPASDPVSVEQPGLPAADGVNSTES